MDVGRRGECGQLHADNHLVVPEPSTWAMLLLGFGCFWTSWPIADRQEAGSPRHKARCACDADRGCWRSGPSGLLPRGSLVSDQKWVRTMSYTAGSTSSGSRRQRPAARTISGCWSGTVCQGPGMRYVDGVVHIAVVTVKPQPGQRQGVWTSFLEHCAGDRPHGRGRVRRRRLFATVHARVSSDSGTFSASRRALSGCGFPFCLPRSLSKILPFSSRKGRSTVMVR